MLVYSKWLVVLVQIGSCGEPPKACCFLSLSLEIDTGILYQPGPGLCIFSPSFNISFGGSRSSPGHVRNCWQQRAAKLLHAQRRTSSHEPNGWIVRIACMFCFFKQLKHENIYKVQTSPACFCLNVGTLCWPANDQAIRIAASGSWAPPGDVSRGSSSTHSVLFWWFLSCF